MRLQYSSPCAGHSAMMSTHSVNLLWINSIFIGQMKLVVANLQIPVVFQEVGYYYTGPFLRDWLERHQPPC